MNNIDGDANPVLSVVIPTFNSSPTIQGCLRSILASDCKEKFEIIVIDDASTDNTVQVVESIACENSAPLSLFRQSENRGPASARNFGARLAKANFILFLDSDTAVYPDTISNFLARIEDTDAVTGIYSSEPLNPNYAGRYKALFNNYIFSRSGVVSYTVFAAACAGIRKDVFLRLGGFNEDLEWGNDIETEEFGYRLAIENTNLLDPSVQVMHSFPGFLEMTYEYFHRVNLWTQLFTERKAFDSAVATPATGVGTLAPLFGLIFFLLTLIDQKFLLVALVMLLVYLVTYWGFFCYTFQKRPGFLLFALLANLYFSIVISIGAFVGLIIGLARLLKKANSIPKCNSL